MKKIFAFLITLAILSTPTVSLAQTTDSAAQIQLLIQQIQAIQNQLNALKQQSGATAVTQPKIPPSSLPTSSVELPQNIPTFNNNLYFGVKNNPDVSDLQEFLTEQGYYAGPISGNFGLLTLGAVKKFQSANGIKSTGYFGLRSRAVANEIVQKLVSQICPSEEGCEGNVLPAEKIYMTADSDLRGIVGEYLKIVFKAFGGSGNYYIQVIDGDVPGLSKLFGCEISGDCPKDKIALAGAPIKSGVFSITFLVKDLSAREVYGKERFTITIKDKISTSKPPVISGIKGPTTLKAGEEGIWTINASDPQNGNLNYRVIWGDGDYTSGIAKELAPQVVPFRQTAIFSHTYSQSGIYNPAFYVVNDRGLDAKTSISVNVIIGEQAVYRPVYSVEVSGSTVSTQYGAYTTLVRGQTYNFTAKATNGKPDSNVLFSLQRPDGTMKYSNQLVSQGAFTDSQGTWIAPTTQTLTLEGQNGTWASWVSVGGVESNKVYHNVIGVATPTQPSIQVLSPNGGESFTPGSQMQVRWSTQNYPANTPVNIYLFTSDVTPATETSYQWVANVAFQTLNDGVETWVIPSNITTGSRYFIRVICYAITSNYFPNGCKDGDSNAPFSIAAGTTASPTITVFAPNGGEKITKGAAVTLQWKWTGDISSVYIKLRKGSDTYYGPEGAITVNIPNTGSYQWTIPTTLPDGNDYTIRVLDAAGRALDDSDSPFSIVAGTASQGPTISASPLGLVSNRSVSSADDIATIQINNNSNSDIIVNLFNLTINGTALKGKSVTASLIDPNTGTLWSGSSAATFPTCQSSGCSFGFGFLNTPPVISANTSKTIKVRIDSSNFETGTLNAAVDVSYEVSSKLTGRTNSTNIFSGTYLVGATQPSITVLSPNGGETLEIGKTYNIRWSGNNGTLARFTMLSEDGNTALSAGNLPYESANDGIESWTISNITPGKYRLRIYCPGINSPGLNTGNCDYNNNKFFDDSDAPFSIVAAPTVTNSGLIGYWKFDEGSGTTVADSSRNGNTGTLVNNPAWTNGRSGSAISFDGIDDFIRFSDASVLKPSTWTVESWFQPNSASGYHTILSNGRISSPGLAGIALRISNNGLLELAFHTASDEWYYIASTSALIVGKWYHAAATYDGSVARLYLDGAEVSKVSPVSKNMDYSAPADVYLKIGSGSYQGQVQQPFSGIIDEVRIYNYALTQSEIQSDMNAGVAASVPRVSQTSQAASILSSMNDALKNITEILRKLKK